MAINYAVQSEVIDIRADRPKPTDVFLVDTNVWLWMTYSVASQTPNPPVQSPPAAYPKYFKRALAARARFCWCGLSLSELAHTIEKAEFGLFAATNPSRTLRRQGGDVCGANQSLR